MSRRRKKGGWWKGSTSSALREVLEALADTDVEGPYVCLGCGKVRERWFACGCCQEVEPLSEGGEVNDRAVSRFGRDRVEAYLERYLEPTVRSRLSSPRTGGPLQIPSLRALAMLAEPLDFEEPQGLVLGGDPRPAVVDHLDAVRVRRNARFSLRRPLDRVPREALRHIACFSDVEALLALERSCRRLKEAASSTYQEVFKLAALSAFPVVASHLSYMPPNADFRQVYRHHLDLEHPTPRAEAAVRLEPTTSLDDYLFTVRITGLWDPAEEDDAIDGVVACSAVHDVDYDFISAQLPSHMARVLKWTVDAAEEVFPVALRVDCLRKTSGKHAVLYDDGRIDDIIGDELFFESQDIQTKPCPTSCAFVEHVPGGRHYELSSQHILQPTLSCYSDGKLIIVRFHSDTMVDRDDMPLPAILVLLEHDVEFS